MTFYKCYLCFAISSVLIHFARKQFRHTLELLDTGFRTKAKVLSLVVKKTKDGILYTPIFEYTNLEGKLVAYQSDISSYPPRYEEGQEVSLVYSEATGDTKIISFWGLFWTSPL